MKVAEKGIKKLEWMVIVHNMIPISIILNIDLNFEVFNLLDMPQDFVNLI